MNFAIAADFAANDWLEASRTKAFEDAKNYLNQIEQAKADLSADVACRDRLPTHAQTMLTLGGLF